MEVSDDLLVPLNVKTDRSVYHRKINLGVLTLYLLLRHPLRKFVFDLFCEVSFTGVLLFLNLLSGLAWNTVVVTKRLLRRQVKILG